MDFGGIPRPLLRTDSVKRLFLLEEATQLKTGNYETMSDAQLRFDNLTKTTTALCSNTFHPSLSDEEASIHAANINVDKNEE